MASAESPGSDRSGESSRPDALIARICVAFVRTLPVTGAAVSLMTPGGHRGVVSATDATARQLEDIQFTTGEGPGVDAFNSGRSVLVPHLELTATKSFGRWPTFVAAARELGVRAVFAFPLQLGAASLGALTAYHVEPAVIDGAELAKAIQLSDATSFTLLDLLAELAADAQNVGYADPTAPPDAELYRAEIYQAAGMLMVQLEVSIEVAIVRLRSYAFATGRPTGDVARDIVRRRLRLEGDNG